MKPVKTDTTNTVFTAPDCYDLPVNVNSVTGEFQSYWMPDADELAALNAGLPVRLSVFGMQPPVRADIEQVLVLP